MTFAILYRGRRYVEVTYPTEREALAEMASLLRPYPEGHYWREALSVQPWEEQGPRASRVRQNQILLTHDGRTQTILQWAHELGLSASALHFRLKSGWELDRALSLPNARVA